MNKERNKMLQQTTMTIESLKVAKGDATNLITLIVPPTTNF